MYSKNISEYCNYIADVLVKEENRFKFDLKYKSIAKDIDSERKWLSVKEMGDKYANPIRKRMRSNAPSERAMFKYSLPFVRDESRQGIRNVSVIHRGERKRTEECQNGEEKINDNSEASSKHNIHNINANNNNITVVKNNSIGNANNMNGRKNKFQCKIEFKNCKSFRENHNENNKKCQLIGNVNNKNYDGVNADMNVKINTNHNNLKLWDNKKDKWEPFSKTTTNANTSHQPVSE